MLDASVQKDAPARSGDALGEEAWQQIVSATDAEEAVAFDGVFGGLLPGERGYADDAMVGGVEAFDIADGAMAEVRGRI